ncbi:hypothetical protein BJX64DRAFT_253803 [Aspergillus heterothallicus]
MAIRNPRYSSSRQKVCRQCATAKARCERRRDTGSCVRCAQRALSCSYTRGEGDVGRVVSNGETVQEHQPATPCSLSSTSVPTSEGNPEIQYHNPNTARAAPEFTVASDVAARDPAIDESNDDLDFSSLNLICPINADDIQNRWIQAYIPVPNQQVKNYPSGVAKFIYRTLKSYAAAAVHARGTLPFIHHKQIGPQLAGSPLSTCLSLVQICANQIPGGQSAAAEILQREMHAVFQNRTMYNAESLFVAFQAYLIYAMVLFFLLNEETDRHFRDIMTSLQELACATARHGLVCAAGQLRARPRWEEWIIAEAKRRTLFVMYLFDSILSTQEGLPTFLGIELRGLPAPAGKLLWQASCRNDWEREYTTHLVDWLEGSLTIDELWPTPADLDARMAARRGERVDRWLENLDEYGTMLYAIMQCTHGG